MNTHTIVFLSVLALLATSSHGQNTTAASPAMAGLRGVMVEVVPLDPEIEGKGLTPFVIAVEVEKRLRDGGVPVYKSGAPELAPGLPTVYVEVNAILTEYTERCTWAVRLDLMQAVRLERNINTTAVMASTWSVGGVAYVTKDWRRAIIDDVAGYTDQFVAAFAAANPEGIEP